MSTTIQVETETKEKLENLKESGRQTYDEIITKLLEEAEEDNMEFSEKTKAAIAKGREDIKKGRVYSTRELISELKI
jgi:predicted transcriptional regulator